MDKLQAKLVVVDKLQAKLVVVDKLQALVYDILPTTIAVFNYAIGSGKLSANEQVLLLLFCFFLVLEQ